MPEDTTFVASLRFLGALHLRIEQIAPTDADAAHAAETLTTLLAVLKSVEQTRTQMHPNATSDASVLELMNSAKIEQHRDRAVLTASIPLDLVKRLTTPSPEGDHDLACIACGDENHSGSSWSKRYERRRLER